MRKSIKNVLVNLIATAMMYASSTLARDIYVSPKGNDHNDGLTPQTAQRTLDRVVSGNIQPGDRVLLEGNQIFNGTLTPTCSGTEEAPITFTSYNGIAKIIGSERAAAIYLNSNKNLKIDNLDLSAPTRMVVLISNKGDGCDKIKFSKTYIHNCKENGIEVTNPKDSNITLENCTIENTGGSAVVCYNNGPITLKGNHIRGNGIKPAIGLYGVQKAIVEDNEVSTAVAPKPIFLEMDRKPAFYIADGNTWRLPRTMYEGFVVNKIPMGLSAFKRLTGQHANDNRPGAGTPTTLALPQNPSAPVQPTYQTPQGLVDPRTQPGWNGMNKFVQWNVWSRYTNALEQLKQRK